MTEIFLAYDASDRNRARPVRDALAAQGFDVHWDLEAPPGTPWETWVRRCLAQCKCVVLLRSAASAQSNRMSHVAALAEERGKLIVVRLERSIWQALGQPPGQGAAGTEGIELANWSGDQEHPGWQELCRRIEGKLKTALWVQRLMHEVEADRARWHAQYETSAARCRALNAELATERSECDAAQDKAAGLQALLEAGAKARLQLQACITELEQRLSVADGRHAEAYQLLDEELRQKSAQLSEAQAALKREQDETVRLRTELAAVESARQTLSAQVADQAAALEMRDAQIADLDARVAKRTAEVEELRTVLSEREAETASLRARMTEREAEAASLRAGIADRDTELRRLRSALAQRDAEVGGLKAAVAQRDTDIGAVKADLAGLRAGLTERDRYVADLEASVTQRDNYIASLTATLTDRQAYLADLEASIAQRDTHIADLKATVAERDGQIASLKAGLKELERRTKSSLGASVPLPALGRAALPVAALAGIALSVLKLR